MTLMKKFLSATPWPYANLLAIMRITLGLFLTIHGWEIMDNEKMAGYLTWDVFKETPALPYIGKCAELVAGILLIVGLFTRIAALLMICTFSYITFFVGKGKFWMDDQHPFLLVLFGFLFLFTGGVKWCMDRPDKIS